MARFVLITGGTRGIGKAMAEAFKKQGDTVVSTYVKNDEAAQKFQNTTGIAAFKWDVSQPDTIEEKGSEILNRFGPPQVLINNAGITRDALLIKMTPSMWRDVIDTNLSSLFYMTSWAVPLMIEKNTGGRILNLSSVNALTGQKGQTNYAAAKAGILGFTKSLALELARFHITVNAIAPGYTETDMVKVVPQEILKTITASIPLKGLGSPKDIASMAVYLASDEAAYITGSTLHINGGHFMP